MWLKYTVPAQSKGKEQNGENEQNFSLTWVAEPTDFSHLHEPVTKVAKQFLVINTTNGIPSTLLTLHILLLWVESTGKLLASRALASFSYLHFWFWLSGQSFFLHEQLPRCWFQGPLNSLCFIDMSNPMMLSAFPYINKDTQFLSDCRIRAFR